MSGLIHLVRHGTHDEVGRVLSGRSDIDLNVAGKMQAASLVSGFDGMPVGAVHSSPRRRTMETAGPFAASRGLAVIGAAALDEIDFGAFTGRSFAALDGDPDWHRWNASRAEARCPGGETMREAVARATTYLWSITVDAPVVCVTHCDIIRGVVAASLGMPLDRIFALECDPGSVTTLDLDGDGVRLVRLNVPVPPPAGSAR